MKIVDLAKDLRLAAVERAHPQRVVFHHVPKCGGTSIGRALRKRYLLSQSTINPEASFHAVELSRGPASADKLLPEVVRFRQMMLLYFLCEDIRCVSAHVWFSPTAHARFKDTYKFITVLREPVSRFLSNYRWSHGKENDHGRIDLPLEAFLETERAVRFGAMYVQYFSGLPAEADMRSAEAVDAAIQNLEEFDIVGRLQDMERFEQEVQSILQVRVRVGHENRAKTASESSLASLDPALRARIEEICAPDLAVWRRFQNASASGERE